MSRIAKTCPQQTTGNSWSLYIFVNRHKMSEFVFGLWSSSAKHYGHILSPQWPLVAVSALFFSLAMLSVCVCVCVCVCVAVNSGFIKKHLRRRGSLQSGTSVPLAACWMFTPEAVSVQLSFSRPMTVGGTEVGRRATVCWDSSGSRTRETLLWSRLFSVSLCLIARKHTSTSASDLLPMWEADGSQAWHLCGLIETILFNDETVAAPSKLKWKLSCTLL